MQLNSQPINKGQMLSISDSLRKFADVNIRNNMDNGQGMIYAYFLNQDSLIKEFGPLDSFNIKISDYDSVLFVYKNIIRSEALGMEDIVEIPKMVLENEKFKYFPSFVKKPDAIDNTTIPFSHEEFIDLLAGDMGLSGLLYTIKIEDDADPRKISVTPLESENYIDISEMDSSTFEVQVRLKSFDELKRNTGIESKGWNRDVPPFPIGVILKDNSGTNHEKEISLMFQKFKKGKGN